MRTRTRDFDMTNKIKISEKGKSFQIPREIQKEIDEKGFFVYEWIDQNELKTSIEIDFLKKMLFLGPMGFALMILFAFIGGIIASFGFLAIFTVLLIIYLMVTSISRSLIASKINFLVITSKYFSINRKVGAIQDNSIFVDEEILKMSDIFEEDIFSSSRLSQTKAALKKSYSGGISHILEGTKRIKVNKDSGQAMLLIFGLLVAFFLTMSAVYIFGIFLVMIFGWTTAFLIKRYLIWKGHLVIMINEYFKSIERFSKNLKTEKDSLEKYLKEASQNNWNNGLLLKINSGIEKVNKNAKNASEKNLQLVGIIKNSEYNEIFDYNLYNSWIKKQIITPIKGTLEMLEANISRIETEKETILNEGKNTQDEKLQAHLEVAQKRLLIKKEQIESLKSSMQQYLEKLAQ